MKRRDLKLFKLANIVAVLIGACLLLQPAQPASAHANLAKSQPVQDTVLQESPADIRLQFTEGIDPALSIIVLEDEAGKAIGGKLSSTGERSLLFEIGEPLPQGVYKVRWQVLSVDTHVTEGSFRFSVGAPLEKEQPQDAISLDGAPEPVASGTERPSGQPQPTPTPAASPPGNSADAPASSAAAEHEPGNNAPAGTQGRDESPAGRPDQAEPASGRDAGRGEAPERTGDELSVPPASNGANRNAEEEDETAESTAQPESTGDERPDAISVQTDQAEVPDPGAHTGSAGASLPEHDQHGHEHGETGAAGQHEDHHSASLYEKLHRWLRIVELFATTALAAFLVVRHYLWNDSIGQRPALLAQSRERLLYGLALAVFAVAGLLQVGALAYEFARLGGRSVWELAPAIVQSTMIGKAALLRVLLSMLLLALVYIPARRAAGQSDAVRTAVKMLLCAGLIVLFPLTGHAYAAEGSVLYAVASHVVHIATAAIWFGGLAGLWAMTKARIPFVAMKEAVERFSRIALPSIIAVAVTGIGLALLRVHSWQALFQSDYGRLIVLKSLLLLLVVGIGAIHRLWLIPRLEATAAEKAGEQAQEGTPHSYGTMAGRLITGVRIEIVAAILLFGLAGLLSTTAPPEKTAIAEPLYWHVMGDKAHMSMRIEPKEQGHVLYRLDVWLPEGIGAPEQVKVSISEADHAAGEEIAFQYITGGPDPYGFEGFDKYSYEAYGNYGADTADWTMTIEIADSTGELHWYRKTLTELQNDMLF